MEPINRMVNALMDEFAELDDAGKSQVAVQTLNAIAYLTKSSAGAAAPADAQHPSSATRTPPRR